jgi:hypothetical protein
MRSITDPVCPPGTAFAAEVAAVRGGRRTVDEAAAALRAQLTDDELLWLLDGDLTLIRGGREMSAHYNGVPFEGGRLDRLGIPGIRFTDGPRGIVMGSSTSFPVAIARATRALVGFRPVAGEPGASVAVTVECSTRPLQVWTGGRFEVGVGEVTVEAASYAGDPGAATAVLRLV